MAAPGGAPAANREFRFSAFARFRAVLSTCFTGRPLPHVTPHPAEKPMIVRASLITSALAIAVLVGPVRAAESVGQAASSAARKTGHAVAETGREVGHASAEAGRAVGHATAEAGREVGHATAEAGREVGHATAEAGRKTGHAVKKQSKESKKAKSAAKPASTAN